MVYMESVLLLLHTTVQSDEMIPSCRFCNEYYYLLLCLLLYYTRYQLVVTRP